MVIDLEFNLVKYKRKYCLVQDVLLVLGESGDFLFLTSPDNSSGGQVNRETVRRDVVNILPISLTALSGVKEYRVNGSGADEDLSVEIHLIQNGQGKGQYDIVRCDKNVDTVLTENPLSLGASCNLLAACSSIDWQCLFSNSGDLETVCVANAMAILQGLEAA